MSVRRFTSKDPAMWYQAGGRQIFLADVLDASNSDAMTVGFARYPHWSEATRNSKLACQLEAFHPA